MSEYEYDWEDIIMKIKQFLRVEDMELLVIVGNKADLISEIGNVIDQDELNQFDNGGKFKYIETSAKTGENVEEAFIHLTHNIIKILNSA